MQGSRNPSNRAQSLSVAPPKRATPRGTTCCTGGGENRLYGISNRQEQENSQDDVTGIFKVFIFYVYVFLDPGASFPFLTPYVANKYEIVPKELCKTLCGSTFVWESILEERVYHDCHIYINHKNTMTDLVELDMVDFDFILGVD